MANFLDYLRWRGDLTLAKDHFNTVDAAIMASIAYFPFERLRPFPDKFTVGQAITALQQKPELLATFDIDMQTLVKLLHYSPRLGKIDLLDVDARLKQTPAMQFTGMTFRLNKHELIVAYRGTDHTMVGWSEDMRMSYAPRIEGQQVAVDYLTQIAKQYPNDKITIVGHSKGGNFAVFAGAFVTPEIQARIKVIYNFDGPGFVDSIIEQQSFKDIVPKIKTFVPQGSIFGLMLTHPEPLTIVKSNKQLISQHFPVNWYVVRQKFIKVDSFSSSSNIIDQSIKDWLKAVPPEQREALWNALFDALANLNITSVTQLMNNGFWGALQLSRAYLSLDKPTRVVADKILQELINNIRGNTRDNTNATPASDPKNKKTPLNN